MSLARTTRATLRLAWPAVLAGFLAFEGGACRSAECAEGLYPDGRRCVEPKCEPSCGDHQFCDDTDFPAMCRCAPGYGGDPCSFSGLILDPGFRQEVDTGAWVNEDGKGATVFPDEDDDDDQERGEADLDASVICNAGSLLQTAIMPSYDVAGPFIVEVDYKTEGVNGLGVGFDRSWTRLPPTATWKTETFCLGEGGYGSEPNGTPVEIRVSAFDRRPDCLNENPIIRVDYFDIREDTEGLCPAPGEVVNGTAEIAGPEWQSLREGDVSAGITNAAGFMSSAGARVYREAGSTGAATVSTRLSVPLSKSTSSPALKFWWRGTLLQLFEAELGTLAAPDDRGRQIDTLIGTVDTEVSDNLGEEYTYCLPPWTHGSVLDLSFSLPHGQSGENVELVVDNVAIISDGACGVEPDILDPGFETQSRRWFGASVESASGRVSMKEVEENGVLELAYWSHSAEPTMQQYVWVPESAEGEWPAAFFYSKRATPVAASVESLIGGDEVTARDVQTEGTWELNEVCLPAQWTGRWFRVDVRIDSANDSGEPDDTERVLLDDFSLGTSPNCRIQ